MGHQKIIGPKIEDTHAILSNGSCRPQNEYTLLQKILNCLLINHFMRHRSLGRKESRANEIIIILGIFYNSKTSFRAFVGVRNLS